MQAVSASAIAELLVLAAAGLLSTVLEGQVSKYRTFIERIT